MIDVINLKKSFGSHDVLNGIDITINKGDIVVVIGPSGSGKSTFLRCYYGIDMEIAAALAKKLNKELVIQNMEFDSVCLSVGQHKSDIAMTGLTIKEDRKKYVNFTDPYYNAAQRLIVKGDSTEFDNCKDKAAIEKILKTKDKSVTIGVQNGTTGQFYCEGDKSWGFEGYKVTTTGYKNGSLAVQDLINGNINYVVIDSAPAKCITEAINKMQ